MSEKLVPRAEASVGVAVDDRIRVADAPELPQLHVVVVVVPPAAVELAFLEGDEKLEFCFDDDDCCLCPEKYVLRPARGAGAGFDWMEELRDDSVKMTP